VLQDARLFFGSVKDNIILGAPYVDEELVHSRPTLSGVDHFVRPSPGRPMTCRWARTAGIIPGRPAPVESPFPRPRVCCEPPILLLDEPTTRWITAPKMLSKFAGAKSSHGKTFGCALLFEAVAGRSPDRLDRGKCCRRPEAACSTLMRAASVPTKAYRAVFRR